MGEYVQIGEVETWYEQEGTGDPLVLLHGGVSTNESWAPQKPDFTARFRVLAPERRGHGHTPDLAGSFSYDDMAADTIGFLEAVVDGPAHLVGFSDGGIVGLLIAISRPDLVHKLVAIGANFDTTGLAPGVTEWVASVSPDSDDVAPLRTAYEAVSPDGPQHWPLVLGKWSNMASTQPAIPVEQLGQISAPTLVLVGDHDMISLEHTVALFRAIPNAQLGIVPGTTHDLAKEKPTLVNRLILDFLEQDPSPVGPS